MTRYSMIMMAMFLFVIGSGCDSAVSSMEEDQEQGSEELGVGKARSAVSGTVEEVGADRIRVQGIDYFITAQTVLVDSQDRPVSLGSITPGSTVKIEALQRPVVSWDAVQQPSGRWEALYVVVGSLAPPAGNDLFSTRGSDVEAR